MISFEWLTGGHVDLANAFKYEQPAASAINRPVIESFNWLDFPLNVGLSIVDGVYSSSSLSKVESTFAIRPNRIDTMNHRYSRICVFLVFRFELFIARLSV